MLKMLHLLEWQRRVIVFLERLTHAGCRYSSIGSDPLGWLMLWYQWPTLGLLAILYIPSVSARSNANFKMLRGIPVLPPLEQKMYIVSNSTVMHGGS